MRAVSQAGSRTPHQQRTLDLLLTSLGPHIGTDLSDLIRRMTGCPAYLDSTDLVDLRTLFNEGVHKTDVVVILATKSVFTRPWCLMEMWEAAVMEVPIVLSRW